MKKILSVFVILILLFTSCKNESKNKKTKNSKIESSTVQKNTSEKKKDEKIDNNSFESIFKKSILFCQNEKFTIKIDMLENEKYTYTCWNEPKTIYDKPDLVLENGKAEKQGTMGGYHFIFKNNDWDYIIENNLLAEDEYFGVSLKLLKNGEEKLYTKLQNIIMPIISEALLGQWLKTGITEKEVIDKIGSPDSKSKIEFSDAIGLYTQEWNYKKKGIFLSMASELQEGSKTILNIQITKPCGYKTSKNIGIGSERKEVMEAYSKYVDKRMSNDTQIIAGPLEYGISFTLKNNKVEGLFIGALSE